MTHMFKEFEELGVPVPQSEEYQARLRGMSPGERKDLALCLLCAMVDPHIQYADDGLGVPFPEAQPEPEEAPTPLSEPPTEKMTYPPVEEPDGG